MNANDRASLHQAIMNLPCKPDYAISTLNDAYKFGHRDARHAAAELVLAAEPAERADQWRGIESAPKDGTRIVLWCGSANCTFVGQWNRGKWEGCRWNTPAFWMPLHLPPQEEQARG